MSAPTETSLREKVQERPRNGRARAELALLLSQRRKDEPDYDKIKELGSEAMKLADEAIKVAPNKPFGYVVRSMILQDHKERMDVIHQALNVLQDCNSSSFWTTRIELWIRLLVEPRRHVNNMRRELDSEEQALYEKILDAIHEAPSTESECSTFFGQSHYHLGTFFRKMKPPNVNQPRSRHHFGRAQALLPETHACRELATFWLATLDDSQQELSKCPPDYIVGLYSSFAKRFDELLVTKLSYQTPTQLRKLVDETLTATSQQQWASRAADLGCGTGLSGMAFRDVTQYLIGVDLSPEMIEKARERDCYDELVDGDVTAILYSNSNYDFVFSCDVFVYLGDLEEVFIKVHGSLVDEGVFCFSTELLNESEDMLYKLHECARFAHKQSYVVGLAEENGFQVLAKRICTIRENKGKDVTGCLVVLRKGASSS